MNQNDDWAFRDWNEEEKRGWVIFTPDMSIGPFKSKEAAQEANDTDLQYEGVEYITMLDFLARQNANPELEIEPYGYEIYAEVMSK